MTLFDTQDLLDLRSELRVSLHAMHEAYKEGLRGRDIIRAIFRGRIIEHYPDRQRVLIAGPVDVVNVPLHIVCDYADDHEIVAVTVYFPRRALWAGHLVRRHRIARGEG